MMSLIRITIPQPEMETEYQKEQALFAEMKARVQMRRRALRRGKACEAFAWSLKHLRRLPNLRASLKTRRTAKT